MACCPKAPAEQASTDSARSSPPASHSHAQRQARTQRAGDQIVPGRIWLHHGDLWPRSDPRPAVTAAIRLFARILLGSEVGAEGLAQGCGGQVPYLSTIRTDLINSVIASASSASSFRLIRRISGAKLNAVPAMAMNV